MDKDKLFYTKWTLVRKKGRSKYIILRGFLFGTIVYIVWAVTTIIFDKGKFDESFFSAKYAHFGMEVTVWI